MLALGNKTIFTIKLNECDTLNLRNKFATIGLIGSGCAMAIKAANTQQHQYQSQAKIADAICAALTVAGGATAYLINNRNDAGGKCGIEIELTGTTMTNPSNPLGDTYTVVPTGLTIRGQKCQPGTEPKGTDKPSHTKKPVAAVPGEITGLDKMPLDVAFVIDNTSSMGSSIDEVKAAANTLIADTNWAWAQRRILVATYNDPNAQLLSTFSADPTAATTAINSITVTGGGDTPEAVLSGLMTAINAPWRGHAMKSIILMGDAAPHDPEESTGYTTASVTAAANAVPQQGAPINAVLLGGSTAASDAFTSLANGTGGGVYTAANSTAIVEQLLKALSVFGTHS